MSDDEATQNALLELDKESDAVDQQVAAYQRKLMIPIWNKRREVLKKIPSFWGRVFENGLQAEEPSEQDVEALANLEDFHVEYDDENPNYRKVTAVFKKNDTFKNETLVKEYLLDPEGDGSVISKSSIEYHENKAPDNKRKRVNEDMLEIPILEWFGDDTVLPAGLVFSEELFPRALEIFHDEELDPEDDDDADEIDLGSEDESDEDDEPVGKKAKH